MIIDTLLYSKLPAVTVPDLQRFALLTVLSGSVFGLRIRIRIADLYSDTGAKKNGQIIQLHE